MFQTMLGFARRHIILFGVTKFSVGVFVGFVLGVYFLPVLIAQDGLDQATLAELQSKVQRSGEFRRDLAGSDNFHWGEGRVMINNRRVWLDGKVSPGPDYRLYLTPQFVDDEAGFLAIKDSSRQIGPIRAFSNFSLMLPEDVDASRYSAILIWCEAFGEFITAAELK
ncbi:DM13 domain-containing protein [SAR116 cluster bacterium]|nr:DM13 domain-containing protein [SAR116 cluster bacterium]